MPAAEEYDEARLMVVLLANLALSSPAMLKAIMLDLDRFVGDAPQHDDITLMLLKAVKQGFAARKAQSRA